MPLHGNNWNPNYVTRAVSVYETATKTVRVDTDQGEGFLKALGNPEGPHSLACELVGSLAADWLGLKTLDFAIISIEDQQEVVISGRNYADVGPAFISRAEDTGFTWGGDPRAVAVISNLEHISSLVVLDTWIRNCDRCSPDKTRRNLNNVFFIQRTEPTRRLELIAMDFTHAFTCGQTIDRRLGNLDTIRDESVFGLFPEFRPHLSEAQVQIDTQRLSTFTLADAQGMIANVPVQWQVDGRAKGYWAKFLVDRAHFVSEHIRDILWPVSGEFEYQGESI